MEEIVIKIGKNGKINMSVMGIKGEGCKSLTAAFEKALGMVTETKNTSEAYEQKNTISDQQSIGGSGEGKSW